MFHFSPPEADQPRLQFSNLRANETVFIVAGAMTIAAVFLYDTGGFFVWLAVKIVYLAALILALLNK